MLFSSYVFIFAFLPAAWLVTRLCDRWRGVHAAVLSIIGASLVFYAAWDARFLLLLGGSVVVNFAAGRSVAAALADRRQHRAGGVLAGAIAINLGVLGWFKYAGFFAASANSMLGTTLPVLAQMLPLGISFFTFEQIGYLVDVRRGEPAETDLARYALFVAFFPRLVAGPILRFHEVMPQIPRAGRLRPTAIDLAVGLTLFSIGLAKKTLLADGIGPYAGQVFAEAGQGAPLEALTAWGGVLAYTMQIYFDFSGYSDMAIGLARMFGIRFPTNFNSPYQSGSIIEFWRRWHISLSRFLRDYLYIPLGGNRRGVVRRYANLLATMLLGGLWHGANWTFVAWGLLHGCYLMVNHAWHGVLDRRPAARALSRRPAGRLAGWALTMLAVVVAWVFFRAPTFATASHLLGAMAGANGVMLPAGIVDAVPAALQGWLAALGIGTSDGSGSRLIQMWAWVIVLSAVALLTPNSQRILQAWQPVLEQAVPAPGRASWWQWQPTRTWGVVTATIALAGMLAITRGGEFLYWQF